MEEVFLTWYKVSRSRKDKNTLSSGRDIIFRCQFHTGAVRDYGLELDKTELDDACKGMYLMFLIGLKNTQALRHSRPPPKWRPK